MMIKGAQVTISFSLNDQQMKEGKGLAQCKGDFCIELHSSHKSFLKRRSIQI